MSNDTLRKLVDGDWYIKNNGLFLKLITDYSDKNIFTGQVSDMSNLFKFNLI